MTTDPLHTIAQAAQQLAVNRHQVSTFIASGELVAVNVAANPRGGRPSWRISQEALEQFQLRRSSAPQKRATRLRPIKREWKSFV
jgi:hypothetical protein